MTLPESEPGIRDRAQAAQERLRQAMLSSWPGEATMPFGLSKRRLEVNLAIVGLLSFIPEVEREAIAEAIQEILANGLAETRIEFYVGERDGESKCCVRQHLDGGGWYDKR